LARPPLVERGSFARRPWSGVGCHDCHPRKDERAGYSETRDPAQADLEEHDGEDEAQDADAHGEQVTPLPFALLFPGTATSRRYEDWIVGAGHASSMRYACTFVAIGPGGISRIGR